MSSQRLWRTVTRRKYQVTCNRVQLRNRLECLLRKRTSRSRVWSRICSGPVGTHAARRRDGETVRRRSLRSAVARLHATPYQFRDALGVCADLHPIYRHLLAMTLDELEVMEAHLRQLDEELAQLLRVHQAAVERLAAVPGLGVDSAQQIIAEVGPTAATFASVEAPGVVGRRLSWARRECGRQSQPSSAERQSADASAAQPGGERCCQNERQYLRSCCTDASSSGSGTRKPLGHCTPPLSAGVKILHDGVLV